MRATLRTANVQIPKLIKLTALIWTVSLFIVIVACGGNSSTGNSAGGSDSSDSVLIESGEKPAPDDSQGEFILVDEMKAARQLHLSLIHI